MNFFRKEAFSRSIIVLGLLFLLVVLTRLPRLLSPHLFFGGDEAILGLMVKHFVEGKIVPGFFYGQNYGLAFIEVLASSPFVAAFGMNIFTVKAPMLLLFTLGLWFLWKFVKSEWGVREAWLFSIVLLLFPGWYLWSMQARGGYVTAFMLFNLTLYLVSVTSRSQSWWGNFSIGLVMTTLYYAQPLWLAGLLPVLILTTKKVRVSSIIMLPIGCFIGYMIWPMITHMAEVDYWSGPPFATSKNIEWNNLWDGLQHSWSGNYFLGTVFKDSSFFGLYGKLPLVLLALSLIFGVFSFRSLSSLSKAIYMGIVLSIAQLYFFGFEGIRYYLPVAELVLLFLLSVSFISWKRTGQRVFTVVIWAMGIVGLAQLSALKMVPNEEPHAEAFNRVIDEMYKHEVKYVYSLDPMLQWLVIFFSNEEIIARYDDPRDRYPEYPLKVDKALAEGETVACLGFHFDRRRELENLGCKIIEIDSTYYFAIAPPKEWLVKQGFKLNLRY